MTPETPGPLGGLAPVMDWLTNAPQQPRLVMINCEPAANVGELAASLEVPIMDSEAAPAGQPIAQRDAITFDVEQESFAAGAALVDKAVDEGVDLLMLAGTTAADCLAGTISLLTGDDPIALLPRVIRAGRIDDDEWMALASGTRDALFRVRDRPRDPHTLLASLGGAALASATGVISQAAARQTPVLVDGPLAAVAVLLARDLDADMLRWCAVADTGQHAALRQLVERLGLPTVLTYGLDVAPGASALLALTVIRNALPLAH